MCQAKVKQGWRKEEGGTTPYLKKRAGSSREARIEKWALWKEVRVAMQRYLLSQDFRRLAAEKHTDIIRVLAKRFQCGDDELKVLQVIVRIYLVEKVARHLQPTYVDNFLTRSAHRAK